MHHVEARRLAKVLSLVLFAFSAAGDDESPVVTVKLHLIKMKALIAGWESGETERVCQDLAKQLQANQRLEPWTFGVLEDEARYQLLFEVTNTESHQIQIYVRLQVDGQQKEEVDLSPVDPRDHLDDLLALAPEKVAGWLVERLRIGGPRAQENLSRLAAKLEEHVPIVRGGTWLFSEEVPYIHLPKEIPLIHLPLARSRYGKLGKEHFRLDCVNQMQEVTGVSHVYASGVDLWKKYEPLAPETHLIVQMIELWSAGERYGPEDKLEGELRQHEPDAVFLSRFTFKDDRPHRIRYRR